MRLLLVDGANVLMRFVHAMVPGSAELADHPAVLEQVPAILTSVDRVIRHVAVNVAQTHHVIVCLDSVESWRKQLYPEYKGNRATTTAIWNNRLSLHCAEHGFHTMRALGFEADDVIATLVTRAAKAGHTSAVLSGDSDLLMLASIFCDVFQFGKKGEDRYQLRTMAWIAERYGIRSARDLRGYKAMVGEQSDNLPGLDGIGKVKAAKLLADHGSIDGVLASGKLSSEQIERLNLMLKLVTLDENIPLDVLPPCTPAQCRITTSLTREP